MIDWKDRIGGLFCILVVIAILALIGLGLYALSFVIHFMIYIFWFYVVIAFIISLLVTFYFTDDDNLR